MAKTKEGRSRSLSKPRNPASRRNSNPEDGQGNNIENGLYVHSSPPKVVSSNGSGSAHIREYLRGGNIAGLEEVVLEGQGPKLLTQSSTDPKVRAFLKTLPSFMSKIDLVHDAAERGNLRDLKTLLDRRKIARSKDSQGLGLMHKAVLSGNAEMVEYLIQNYPETATPTDNERTGDAGGEDQHIQKVTDSAHVISEGGAATLAGETDEDNFLNICTVEDEFGCTEMAEDIHGNYAEDLQYRPVGVQLKEFNERLRSDINSASNTEWPVLDAQTQPSVSDPWDGVVDWEEADENSYFLSDLFDQSNAIQEENADDLSDDGIVVSARLDDTSPVEDPNEEKISLKNEQIGVSSEYTCPSAFEHSDLSSSIMSFTKKMPLPPTASGMRTSSHRMVDDEILKSYLPRRKLSPVYNPRVMNINGTTYEIASPTLVKKLQPIEPKVTHDENTATGAIRKKPNAKKAAKKDRLRSVEDLVGLEKIKKKTSTKPSPRHVAQTSYPVVPNSANIRHLVQRRNKIVFDFIKREVRRSSLIDDGDFFQPQTPKSGAVKLPVLVTETESAPEVVERPRTPTVMPRSARERISVSKMTIDGHTVAAMNFKDGAFKGRMRRSKKLTTGSVRPSQIEEKSRMNPSRIEEKPRVNPSRIEGRPWANPSRIGGKPRMNTSQIEDKPKRKISKPKKVAEINASLGNLVFDGKKKRYPKDKNTGLDLKGCADELQNADANKADEPEPSEQQNRIHFNDDLPPDLQRFCRRLLWSTLAAAQADLGKVFKREIHNELAAEETKQVVFEHDVSYWAKSISDRILDGVVSTTIVTPPSRLQTRRSLKRTSLGDSGIQSGNRSASTQTSNTSSPKRIIKDTTMAEIVAKLEEFNVKLESGKPRYRQLVEQEIDQQSKLKAFQDHWNDRKSSSPH